MVKHRLPEEPAAFFILAYKCLKKVNNLFSHYHLLVIKTLPVAYNGAH
jgi:hypothetical protein